MPSVNDFEICSKIPKKIKIYIRSFHVFIDSYTFDQNIIFVKENDKVYGLGVNNFGLLGLGHNNAVEYCTKIEELSNQKIKEVYIGCDLGLALNEDNHIFGWGMNQHAQLARVNSGKYGLIFKPKLIEISSNEKIVDINCGGHHTLVFVIKWFNIWMGLE